MNVLRQIASYLIPILTVLGQGQYNPLSTDSPFYSLFGPLLIALATYISLRVHPNGVNGQPLMRKPRPPVQPRGQANTSLLIIVAFVCLGLFSGGCALLKSGKITVDASGVCINIPFQMVSQTVECGSQCLPDNSEELVCRDVATKAVQQTTKLQWKKP